MKFILSAALIGCLYLLAQSALEREYQIGLREGRGMALKTNPPSEELELVCAGLWVGEQNKKMWKKENGR
jgi:hypothetical protein